MTPTSTGHLARTHAILLALVMAAVMALTVVGPPTAEASTGKIKPCSARDMSQGKVYRRITLTNQSFTLTHAFRKRIPRGAKFSRNVTMESQRVISAKITASASVKADAGAFFAKASVEAGVAVEAGGSQTSKESITEYFEFAPTRRDRRLVFYSGVETYQFRVERRYCQQGNVIDSRGVLDSFENIEESGALLCPRGRYKPGSLKYRITRDAGC